MLKKCFGKTHTKRHHVKCETSTPYDDENSSSLDADETILRNVNYRSWLNKHPSALGSCQEMMMAAAKGKRIVVFLDYDGTLSPIVPDPERAFMSDSMRSAVYEVAKRYPTAIISGRSRLKVYEFVKLDKVYYAGSHGMDIIGPSIQSESYDGNYQTKTFDREGNELTIFQPAKEFLPALKMMLKELQKSIHDIHGARVEDNKFSISVHYRHVNEKDYEKLEERVKSIILENKVFEFTRGKKVLEIRPIIQWNKGTALMYLLDTLGFANSKDVLPFYIGDDKTDEDAFKVLKELGQGYPIIVSDIPRDTMASHSLRDPSEVLSFLLRLAMWKDISTQ